MFKRANKITSLLIAAAAVVSLVPASAADVKKIDSQDGTLYNAVAYKDGTFYVDGDIQDKDEAAYYVSNGEFTAIDDVDSGDTTAIYGDKYLNVSTGDYKVDLESGKSEDTDVVEDTRDDAASALRKKLNKDDPKDRYVKTAATGYDTLQDKNLREIDSNKFAATWFEYHYGAALVSGTPGKATVNHGATGFTVYTDVDGNYIDADYNLGKVNAIATGAGVVTLKNTNDDDNAARAQIVDGGAIAQDKDYIYRLATLTVYDADGTTKVDQFGSARKPIQVKDANGAIQNTITVIQKISKAQDSGDVDDAKFAKTVNTYFVTDDGGKVKSTYSNWTVVDGKLVNYDVTGGKVYAKAISLKSKDGYYYTDFSDGDDTDCDAVDTDVDGNVYALDGGYIKKFNNDDSFDKVYKVDGSFDKLSIYDKDNMVAWSEDDEVYSLIGAKDAETTTPETPVVIAGWAQTANGAWTYNKADGTKATGWLLDGATWYYLKADGTMATGWVQDGATWYYTNASGAMQTGWINDNGTWYYTNASGVMLANTTVDGYVLGASGAWVK